MPKSLKILIFSCLLAGGFFAAKNALAFGGSGVDGAITISTTTNINTATTSMSRTCADAIAYNVTSLTATSAALATSLGASCLAVNDVILLINLQGDGTNLGNVGNYEFLRVKSTSSNAVYFTSNKAKYYGNATSSDDSNIGTTTDKQRVIIQRVPQYTNVTIQSGGILTASAWDGQKGGVLVFYANGTVTVASGGSIDMSGKGYRGGLLLGGQSQGESYNMQSISYNSAANLGGGGVGDDAIDEFGAGGGYGTGGVSSDFATGGSTYGDSNLSKIFFGSGGGYAFTTNSFYSGGGGIIFIKSTAISVSGVINNNGANSYYSGWTGDGAGGSIYLITGALTLGSNIVSANGGTVGYAGGVGRIALKADSITGTSSPLASSTSVLTKEFTAIVDPDNGAGTNFTSLSAWEAATQADLTSDYTKVFSISSASGTFQVGGDLVGLTSGATASSTYHTATQVLLYNIQGTFLSGERIYVQGQSTTTNYVIISDDGFQAIAVASCRSTSGTADVTAVTIDGWTTASTTYIKIWTDPSLGNRHNGKWDEGKYRIQVASGNPVLGVAEDYVTIDGVQVKNTRTDHWQLTFSTTAPLTRGNGGANKLTVSNSIFWATGNYTERAVNLSNYAVVRFYNNLVMNESVYVHGANIGVSFNAEDNSSYGVSAIYNNTVIGAYNGYADERAVKNCIFLNNLGINAINAVFSGTYHSSSNYNASNDVTSTGGTNDKISQVFTFIDATSKDFHLSPSDTAARNAGTSTPLWDANLSFTQDIDGSYRGGAWDIGADEVPTEFVSTICENASAGGDCANRSYSTLFAWEAAVDSDLTASSTRIFSGIASGTLVAGNSVTLYNGATSTGITGTIVATTTSQILIQNITGTTSPVNVASGTVWQVTTANTWRNAGTLDQLGASPIAVAKIDGAWANPDTTTVDIGDWVTSADNYVKIYTAPAARHNGKWDASKYRREVSGANEVFRISEDFVLVDGLQFSTQSPAGNGDGSLYIRNTLVNNAIKFSNNIYKGHNSPTYWQFGMQSDDPDVNLYAWNNLFYNIGSTSDALWLRGKKAYLYNNTLIGANRGVVLVDSTTVAYAKNNISQSSINGFSAGNGSFATSSDYNISDIAGNAPNATFATTSKVIQFVSTSTADYHLADTDTTAKGAGVNLTGDVWIPASAGMTTGWNDIDSAARPATSTIGLSWDIGADQTAVKIFRSVSPSASSALTTGASNAMTISSSTSLATFATALADNIGVGDMIIYNTGGTATATAFIHGRSSSTVYTVKTASGTLPTAATADTSWSLGRAYTTLANAEAGIENTGVSAIVRNFDDWTSGGTAATDDVGKDIRASNEQWNIAAYANGTTADTVAVTIDGWTTGQQNYIKVYTPTLTSEVGSNQRHQGKWDDTKYRLVASVTYSGVLTQKEDYVRLDGLQIENSSAKSSGPRGIFVDATGNTDSSIKISNNIVRSTGSGTADGNCKGIEAGAGFNSYIWNNAVYDFGINLQLGYTTNAVDYIVYNNTLVNGIVYGFEAGVSNPPTIKYYNNLIQGSVTNYNVNFVDVSANNLSQDTSSPDTTYRSKTVSFIDITNRDYHLSPSDASAVDQGTSTPATDANLSFANDIDGQLRRQWDIGADEGSVEYVTSVMESGGNFSTLSAWEAANQVDLATTSTAVFSLSSASGTIPANSSVMGLTSGAVASTTVGSVSTSTQILLYNIFPAGSAGSPSASTSFLAGERIYIRGGATTSNYAILSNAGNPAIATAKIDGAWTATDVAPVEIIGWTTAPTNYIRVYTTLAARHNGKWNDNKYRITETGSDRFSSYEDFVRIDGVQLNYIRSSGTYNYGLAFVGNNGADISLSNSIIKGNYSGNSEFDVGVFFLWDILGTRTARVWNNIIYDIINGDYLNEALIIDLGWQGYVYNNTIYNSDIGLCSRINGTVASNNLSYGNGENYGCGTNYALSYNNLSSSNDAPGLNPVNNATVQFVDAVNGDFHLAPTDTAAKDAGVDLSTSTTSPFYTDIDGQYRGSQATTSAGGLGFDIGADEGATILYRSVGNTSAAVAAASDPGAVLTISSSTATFLSALPSNVGVGDVIQYGSPLTLAFITGRASSTVYFVQSASGSYPLAGNFISHNIYRAHTLLNNWQTQTTGTVNQSIDSSLRSQVLVARDIVASNTAMFVAAYASSSPDTSPTMINIWTTGAGNYIKVYTPVTASEVGVTQRHSGKWDDSKYRMVVNGRYFDDTPIRAYSDYMRVTGLQIDAAYDGNSGGDYQSGISISSTSAMVSQNIIKRSILTGQSGIYFNDVPSGGTVFLWNNLIYNFSYGFNSEHRWDTVVHSGAIYNNTVINSEIPVRYNTGNGAGLYLQNNIVQNSATNYTVANITTSHNISSDNSSPDVDFRNKQVVFINSATSSTADFHLAPTDGMARDKGVSLAADPNLPFTIDIDGDSRPKGAAWDIGADEAIDAPDYQLEGKIQFEGLIKFW